MYDIHINAAIALTRDWENNHSPNRLQTKNPLWQGKTVADVLMDQSALARIRARAEQEFRNCKDLEPFHIRIHEGGAQLTTSWEIVTKIRGYVWYVTQ